MFLLDTLVKQFEYKPMTNLNQPMEMAVAPMKQEVMEPMIATIDIEADDYDYVPEDLDDFVQPQSYQEAEQALTHEFQTNYAAMQAQGKPKAQLNKMYAQFLKDHGKIKFKIISRNTLLKIKRNNTTFLL